MYLFASVLTGVLVLLQLAALRSVELQSLHDPLSLHTHNTQAGHHMHNTQHTHAKEGFSVMTWSSGWRQPARALWVFKQTNSQLSPSPLSSWRPEPLPPPSPREPEVKQGTTNQWQLHTNKRNITFTIHVLRLHYKVSQQFCLYFFIFRFIYSCALTTGSLSLAMLSSNSASRS